MDKAVENDVDLYEELGVAPDVTDAELKKVYRRLVLRYHPDKLAGQGEAECGGRHGRAGCGWARYGTAGHGTAGQGWAR